MRKPAFCIYAKTKTQISFAITAKLISAFVFATWIVHPSTSYIRNFKPLAIFCGCTARFVSDYTCITHCSNKDCTDHFMVQFRDICEFFYSKSHENCLKKRKNGTDDFLLSLTFFSYKHMQTISRHLACFLVVFPYFLPNKVLVTSLSVHTK